MRNLVFHRDSKINNIELIDKNIAFIDSIDALIYRQGRQARPMLL